MPSTRTYFRSFAGGEMSPEMFGRVDDVKFQTGAATMRNFVALPQGPVENRAGTQFVREVKDSTKRTRLIPFTYSTTQTMVIEVGAGYMRFHTQGATLTPGSPAAYNGATSYVVGDLVSSGGVNYYCIATTTGNAPPNATYWYPQPAGVYEIPTPYAEADIFDLHYVQSADVLTLVHPGYAPRELRRGGATTWTLTTINFAAPVSAPTGLTLARSSVHTEYNYTYVVTAVASDGVSESVASSSATIAGDFGKAGYYITISWTAATGASRYRVYKLQGGLYGFIGETATTSIIDDNIAPDMGITPPVYDTVFNSTYNYPGAVSYFEQRRIFAGTTNDPQTMWMTRSGTESDMSYSIPTEDTDRIKFRVAAREANTIRHIVPLTQLLALTSAAEWRISPVNSDVITPTTISVRPQSYIGASNVQPSIVNNTVIYCAARGGHVRELGYSWQASGFVTGDLSLRAPHLFDTYNIVDMCYSKSPHPLLWFVSNNGRLLGMTYVPEQQVNAWHWHDTDGDFESCTAVAEGNEDSLYVIVNRTIGGNTKRYVERFATREITTLENCFFVDSGLTYDGNNTTATTVTTTNTSAAVTMTIASPCVVTWTGHTLTNGNSVTFSTTGQLPVGITAGTTYYVVNAATNTFQVALTAGGTAINTSGSQNGTHTASTTYTPNNLIGITASTSIFVAGDVGDAIVLTDSSGNKYRLTITAYTSGTQVTARTDLALPAALRNTATTTWAWARDSVSGLSHIEGKTVSILADGAVMPQEVVTSGSITIDRPATVIHVGLPYESDLQTMPISLNVDGAGQGRYKNVNKAWIRVYRSSGVFVGPSTDKLTEAKQRTTEPYGTPPSLKTDELDVDITPSWAASGQIYLRQADPLPLSVIGLTLEVVLGG